MRPCREPRGSGLVKTRATVSDKVSIWIPTQMDTAGNRGFSGTRKRQGQRGRAPLGGPPLAPRSKWVTGAGLKSPAKKKRKLGRACEYRLRGWECRQSIQLLGGERRGERFTYLTDPSNG